MFWLKGCPKCVGTLYADYDRYGPFISCLQCGYYLAEAEEVALRYAWEAQRLVEGEQLAKTVAAGKGRR